MKTSRKGTLPSTTKRIRRYKRAKQIVISVCVKFKQMVNLARHTSVYVRPPPAIKSANVKPASPMSSFLWYCREQPLMIKFSRYYKEKGKKTTGIRRTCSTLRWSDCVTHFCEAYTHKMAYSFVPGRNERLAKSQRNLA